MTAIVCESGDTITYSFAGEFVNVSDNLATFRGTYTITGGTGTFADITGSGVFKGALTCLDPILAAQGAESCADLGAFSDAVMTLRGDFSDPTVAA